MIAFEQFSKQFGTHLAVDALTLSIEAGSVVALLGPNGSGKTTSLKAAAGLVRPSSGRVVLGTPGVPATDPQARHCVSFLPQKVTFPDALTGLEVATFYGALRAAAPGRVADVLAFAALNGASRRAVSTYSGGMVQRLGLAVALLPNAPAILLDEPTAALDPEGLDAFYRLVDAHQTQGRTVLFTSHQLGDVERLADRVAILVSGRLVASLSKEELARQLADRGSMRVRVEAHTSGLLERVQRIAPEATWQGSELVVPGAATLRAHVIAEMQAAGASIVSLTAEEGRLDAFYRELVPRRCRVTNWRKAITATVALAALTACGGSAVGPAEIDTRHDACRFCRMTVSDLRFAAQVVAPGDEPLAFDDLGCLASYLTGRQALRSDAVVFVADHRTREWVRADAATFTRVTSLETPMSSHMIAHRDAASRDADPDARGGTALSLGDIVPGGKGPTP